jgi:hypothetical protein
MLQLVEQPNCSLGHFQPLTILPIRCIHPDHTNSQIKFGQYKGTRIAIIPYGTTYSHPCYALCALSKPPNTCLHMHSVCTNPTINIIPPSHHNKMVWQLQKPLLAYSKEQHLDEWRPTQRHLSQQYIPHMTLPNKTMPMSSLIKT